MALTGPFKHAQTRWRGWLPVLATVFFTASLAYLAIFAARNWNAISTVSQPDPGYIALAAVLYLFAHPVTSAAWILGLRGLGQTLPFREGLQIALTSQIAKYLPGNVAHYFARTGLAKAAGITLVSSSLATLVEILTALLAAGAIAAIATLIDPAPLAVLDTALAKSRLVPAGAVIAIVSAIALVVRLTAISASVVTRMVACQAVNFILVGASFLCIAGAMTADGLPAASAIGIFTMAWIAGYLVPGAPAGLGVREAVLVAWLSPILGPGPAIACTFLHRLLTACCDGIVGLIGYGWMRLHRSLHPVIDDVRS